MGTLKLGAKNGAIASLVTDDSTTAEAVITLPKSTGTLVTTTDLDKLMDLDGDGILDIVDLGVRVKAIEEDYLSKEKGGTIAGSVIIDESKRDIDYSSFTLMGTVDGVPDRTLLKDFHYASGSGETNDAVQYLGNQISDKSIMNKGQIKTLISSTSLETSGGTITGTVKHKKEIIIEPTMPNKFVDIKNRFPTNADGSDAGADGTAFGINFDLDHGNSGYNQVKFTNRDGNILAVNGGTQPAVKYSGRMTENLHIVTKGYVDTELAAATATIKELTVRLAKLEAKK